ncbi:reverse transcriptase/maturase [Streptomyces lydicamycinicus]|uniref:Reverse transcriptase/maturase n=1 Tax=Streptomyces lydicamycinicus TaxID=1546107 RepID=A0A0P4R9Z9_9ACTN|nr:reverse transcriptase/maturase [Streptomyces lydicamycinicus]
MREVGGGAVRRRAPVTGAAPYGRMVWRPRDRSGPGIPYSRSTQDKAPDRAGKKRR